MERWPKAPRRRRRRPGSRRAGLLTVAVFLLTLGVTIVRHGELSLPSGLPLGEPPAPTTDTTPLSPDLYGTPSAVRPWGRFVDTPDDAVARLLASGRAVQHAVLDGGGVVPPPLHPDLPMWESVVRFLRGDSWPSTIELDPIEADTTPGADPTGAS